MEISKRVLSVAPSVTLAITAKANEMRTQGIDVVSLSAGEPDFDTPDHIKKAAIDALQKGMTKYTPVAGLPDLRKAIVEKFKKDQGLQFSPDQIVVSVGAKHSIFNILFALLNEQDEVAIPAPYWLSYPEMVSVLGGRSRFIETKQEQGFKLSAETLRGGLSRDTKVLIVNSPSNPTGAVYSSSELQELIRVLKDFPKIVVISDEIYEKLIFDGQKHISIATLDPEIAKRTVIVNGHSKAYSMTGWRLGYAACPQLELAKAVSSIQSHSTSNPTAFAQAGGIEALYNGNGDADRMRKTFEKRRGLFLDSIRAIGKLKPFVPQGAFYLFVDISGTGLGSVEFSKRLLEEARVAVVPGKPFGSDQHVRMSFATSEKNLKEAAKRIAAWIQQF